MDFWQRARSFLKLFRQNALVEQSCDLIDGCHVAIDLLDLLFQDWALLGQLGTLLHQLLNGARHLTPRSTRIVQQDAAQLAADITGSGRKNLVAFATECRNRLKTSKTDAALLQKPLVFTELDSVPFR